jgi:hypothetical protein
MAKHSRLSPSASCRWVACPGSVTLSERYPEPPGSSSESAAEGTASHWVGEQLLLGKPAPAPGTRCAENGVVLSMEMIDGAHEYAGVVRQVSTHTTAVQLHVEDRLQVPRIHAECFGTVDCWFWLPYSQELHIFDYKFGWQPVEAARNHQLICYAAGAMDRMGITDTSITVVLHIVQPRPHHPLGTHREWRVSGVDIAAHIVALNQAATLALGPEPQACSGEHCKYCRARHACPALGQAAMIAVDYACQAQPDDLSPAAMALEYRTLERVAALVKARLSGHEARMIGTLQAGGVIPGYSLESGYGRAAWTRPVAEVLALGEMMGVSLGKQDVITPVAARKLGLSDSVLAAYSGKEKTGLKLVAAAGSKAALAFGQAQGV